LAQRGLQSIISDAVHEKGASDCMLYIAASMTFRNTPENSN